MKLRNKLLPLVGIATACAALTPLALTSCNKSDLVDLTKVYTPKYEAHAYETEAWSQQKAYDTYCGLLADEPDRVADELYWSRSMSNALFFSDGSSPIKVVSDKQKIENVSLKKVEFEPESNEKVHLWTISYDRTFDYLINFSWNSWSTYSYDISSSGKINMKNVPITLTFDGDYWHLSTLFADNQLSYIFEDTELSELFETSITTDIDYSITSTYKTSSGTTTDIKDLFYKITIDDSASYEEWQKWEEHETWYYDEPSVLDCTNGGAYITDVMLLSTQWTSHYLFNVLGEEE